MNTAYDFVAALYRAIPSAISSTLILGVLAFLSRSYISSWLSARFNSLYQIRVEEIRAMRQTEMESLKGEIAKEIEKIRAEYSAQSREIDAIRAGIFGPRAARQAIIDKRRIESIEEIWDSLRELKSLTGIVMTLAVTNFDVLAAEAEENDAVRTTFKQMTGDLNKFEINRKLAHVARLYIPPLAYSLFDAYRVTIAYSRARMAVIHYGVGKDAMKGPEEVIALLGEAVPLMKDRLDKVGVYAFPEAMEALEKRILDELQNALGGKAEDEENFKSAKALNSMIQEVEKAGNAATA